MDVELWNALHDGNICKVEGTPPGEVIVWISIAYLRRMWAGEGSALLLHLQGCDYAVWNSYDSGPDQVTVDLSVLEDIQPFILQALHQTDDMLAINCESGDLILRYEDAAVRLDTGEQVTIEDVKQKSELYWRNF